MAVFGGGIGRASAVERRAACGRGRTGSAADGPDSPIRAERPEDETRQRSGAFSDAGASVRRGPGALAQLGEPLGVRGAAAGPIEAWLRVPDESMLLFSEVTLCGRPAEIYGARGGRSLSHWPRHHGHAEVVAHESLHVAAARPRIDGAKNAGQRLAEVARAPALDVLGCPFAKAGPGASDVHQSIVPDLEPRLAQDLPTLGTHVPGIDASPVPVPAGRRHGVDVLARARVEGVNGNIRFERFERTLSAKAKCAQQSRQHSRQLLGQRAAPCARRACKTLACRAAIIAATPTLQRTTRNAPGPQQQARSDNGVFR